MNCTALRRELLKAERSDRPAPPAAAHLAACAACRRFQQQLMLAEHLAGELPAPSADEARAELLRRLGREPAPTPARAPAPRRSVALILGSWILDPHAAPARRVAAGLVAGLAAAVMILFVGWMIWFTRPGPERPAILPLAADLRRQHVVLREASTPRERLAALADAADELCSRGERLAFARPDDLQQLARLYDRVVCEGLIPGAEELPAEQRSAALTPICRQLTEAESLASRLAVQADLPAASALALQRIALAADLGRKELLRLRDAS